MAINARENDENVDSPDQLSLKQLLQTINNDSIVSSERSKAVNQLIIRLKTNNEALSLSTEESQKLCDIFMPKFLSKPLLTNGTFYSRTIVHLTKFVLAKMSPDAKFSLAKLLAARAKTQLDPFTAYHFVSLMKCLIQDALVSAAAVNETIIDTFSTAIFQLAGFLLKADGVRKSLRIAVFNQLSTIFNVDSSDHFLSKSLNTAQENLGTAPDFHYVLAVLAPISISRKSTCLTQINVELFLKSYALFFLKGGHKICPALPQSLPSMISNISDAENFENVVIPTLERMLLREKEVALVATPKFLADFQVDMGKLTESSLMNVLLQAAQSKIEIERTVAIQLSSVLAKKVQSIDTLNKICVEFANVLQGPKAGNLAAPKVCAANCLTSINDVAAIDPAKSLVHEKILTILLAWLSSSESNEEARSSGVHELVKCWASHSKGNFDKDVQYILKKSIDSSSVMEKTSTLQALADYTKDKDIENISQLYSSLYKLAQDSKGQLIHHLLSYSVIVFWSSKDVSIKSAPEFSKILSHYLDDDGLVVRRSEECWNDAELNDAFLKLVKASFTVLDKELESKAKATETMGNYVIKDILLRKRERADQILKAIIKDNAEADKYLIKSFWNTVSSFDIKTSHVDMYVARKTLLNCCADVIPEQLYPLVFISAHSPFVYLKPENSSKFYAKSFWGHCFRKKKIPSVTEWTAEAMNMVFGTQGLRSEISNQKRSAINAIRELGATFNNQVYSHIFPNINALLDSALAANLKPEDYVTYRSYIQNPSDLDQLEEQQTSREADEKEKTSMKPKSKQLPKKDVSASARDKQHMQVELDRQKREKELAAERRAKLQADKQIFFTVKSVVDSYSVGLEVVQTLAKILRKATHEWLPSITPLVLGISVCEPVHSAILQTFVSLCGVADDPISCKKEDFGYALFRLSQTKIDLRPVDALIDLSESLRSPLSGESFALVLPIIKVTLLHAEEANPESVRAALNLMNVHVGPKSIGGAITAAQNNAGSWLLAVLEREDALFTLASKALTSLSAYGISLGSGVSQILQGLLSGKSSVREVVLDAIEVLPEVVNDSCERNLEFGRMLWLASHDIDTNNASRGDELWENYNHPLSIEEDVAYFLEWIGTKEQDVRTAACCALADALSHEEHTELINSVISKLFTLYVDNLPKKPDPKAKKPKLLLVKADKEKVDMDLFWYKREGVALTLKAMSESESFGMKNVPVVFIFLASRGLGDEHDVVRTKMTNAAVALINLAGTEGPEILIPMIESHLSREVKGTADEIAQNDRIRQNLVVCLGTVAGFLPEKDERILAIVERVIKVGIETPSEAVQQSASKCLIPLAPSVELSFDKKSDELLQIALGKKSFGEKKGAAYCLSGLVNGLGLRSMKKINLMNILYEAGSSKDANRRQGTFIIVETLSKSLGSLFEPYLGKIIPLLLEAMGDSNPDVRNSGWAASQGIMASLTAHGVQMILSALLSGLEDRSWRTKAGAAEILGSMAFCAPRQLALCLPQIIPKLTEVLADAHPKVVSASEAALGRISAVARNPEVRQLSKFLLGALQDPTNKTHGALEAMLATEFIHAVDPASLALLVPPLHRGLRERQTETKKKAASIVGSMCSHVSNPQDIVPYLDMLIPDLRKVLLDPIPDARKTSAKALGSLAAGLGEENIPDLVDWLRNTMKDESLSPAERSGAAMGLAEVSAAMSNEKIDLILEHVFSSLSRLQDRTPESLASKEGGLYYLAYLPEALGSDFEAKLPEILPNILAGLSEDSEGVREAAMLAGKGVIIAFGISSLDQILPPLMDGLQDRQWRIRQSSIQLLGDLLLAISSSSYNLEAASKKKDMGIMSGSENEEEEDEDGVDEDDDDLGIAPITISSESAMKTITEVLGERRRNEVLAALYIVRSDAFQRVRQVAVQVWKSIVYNTPKIMREILPITLDKIVALLACDDEERWSSAGRALSDLAQKLGDRILPEILPKLNEDLQNENPNMRRGACKGLLEVVQGASKQQLQLHDAVLVSAVEKALCDSVPDVRRSAAEILNSLSRALGLAGIEPVVSAVIVKLTSESDDEMSDCALDGLKRILLSCGVRLINIIVPKLARERPLRVSSAIALGTASEVGAENFALHIDDVIRALIEGWLPEYKDSASAEAAEIIFGSIQDHDPELSVDILSRLADPLNNANPLYRIAGAKVVESYCKAASIAATTNSERLLELLIRQLGDVDDEATVAASEALLSLSKNVLSSTLYIHLPTIRQSFRITASGANIGAAGDKLSLKGLQIPKGPEPFVSIITEGLLHGSPELREQAALAMAELVEYSDLSSIKPYLIKLTGPLIRVISDRFPWQVKAAILQAMLRLLEIAAPALRTFAPQLQSTFLKNISDPSKLVRSRCEKCIVALVSVQPQIGTLIKSLINLINVPEPAAVRCSVLRTLANVISLKPTNDAALESIITEALYSQIVDEDREVRMNAAKVFTPLVKSCLSQISPNDVVDVVLRNAGSENDNVLHGIACSLQSILMGAYEGKKDLQVQKIEKLLDILWNSSDNSVREASVTILGALYIYGGDSKKNLLKSLVDVISDETLEEIRCCALSTCGIIGRQVDRLNALTVILTPVIGVSQNADEEIIRYTADQALRDICLTRPGKEKRAEIFEVAKKVLSNSDYSYLNSSLKKLIAIPDTDEEEE